MQSRLLFVFMNKKPRCVGIRGNVGLVSPRNTSYIVQRSIFGICPMSRVPSCVPCPVRCPMSRPVSHATCPMSLVPCTVLICIAGWLRKTTLGRWVLGPLHRPCGGLCFLQKNEPMNPCTKVYLGRMHQTFVKSYTNPY